MSKDKEILDSITDKEYEHGFVTDVEQEFIPKGLNEDIIRLISAKKDEPEWMLEFRLNAFRKWIKKDPHTRLYLAEGLAMALSFKLGGEILRTVVVRDMSEIMQVGAIIVLRAALTLLIHWEIKNEEKEIKSNKHSDT